ncbi:MAG: zinc ribbon domain-containing protein [Acidobacteria bacterium]|nr:MAG: zinc ribbon domain-containing protein [Acidobacteriota bacterium]
MPLYEYRCQSCGQLIEVIQKFSDAPLETCQKCNGKLERLLSAAAIQFKGTGWYITDYARKNGKNGSSHKEETKAKPAESSSNSTTSTTESTKSTKAD